MWTDEGHTDAGKNNILKAQPGTFVPGEPKTDESTKAAHKVSKGLKTTRHRC